MFTLKIVQRYYERSEAGIDELKGESTGFFPADRAIVQCDVENIASRDALVATWQQSGSKLTEMTSRTRIMGRDDDGFLVDDYVHPGKLIEVSLNDEHEWYTASLAWILGPDGRTIERIAP